MFRKLKNFITRYKNTRAICNASITPKGESFSIYLQNKINGIDQPEINAYEEILDGKDLNLYYSILKAVQST